MVNNRMSKCFMNGKTCIYEREIDNLINNKRNNSKIINDGKNNETEKKAFVIMPFEEQLNLLYQLEIAPFFRSGGENKTVEDDDNSWKEYKCIPERADDIKQMGFIICEKICKKIQEADYIIADLSLNNPNVFYELGLAAALQKKIIPICFEDILREGTRESDFGNKLGINKLLKYPSFGMINSKIRDYLWQPEKTFRNFTNTSGYNVVIIEATGHKIKGSTKSDKDYEFGKLCRTTVITALSQIFSTENMKQKPELKNLYDTHQSELIVKTPLNSDSSLSEVIKSCEKAACVLIDISDHNEYVNFFWLGYIHGIGGNAIPITTNRKFKYSTKENLSPFDIRALWQISFEEDHPIDLLNPLRSILEHIYILESKNLNRESFWKDILKDNNVSIFLGSHYLKDKQRNTIGDWDYRAAAEITSYLSASKETMKITLENPIPKNVNPDKEYIDRLKKQLEEKNSIIIASADVNDLTEIALCEIFNQTQFSKIPKNSIDTQSIKNNTNFKGYIAYKTYKKYILDQEILNGKTEISNENKGYVENAFYEQLVGPNNEKQCRGFLIRESGRDDHRIVEKHFNPDDKENEDTVHKIYGQLVVAKNQETGKWTIIISGISGPATLGIAQMLTGCMYEEFTIKNIKTVDKVKVIKCLEDVREGMKRFTDKTIEFSSKADIIDVPYNELSEYMLSRLFGIIKNEMTNCKKKYRGINVIITVHVYYPPNEHRNSTDDRKVIIWEFTDVYKEAKLPQWANPNNLFCTLDVD